MYSKTPDFTCYFCISVIVKSNAIVYAKDSRTIDVGAGIKAEHTGLVVSGSVISSDAFFPFADGIEAATETGIAVVIQPGGSMCDAEVIEAVDKAGMAMVFTGMRHFRH